MSSLFKIKYQEKMNRNNTDAPFFLSYALICFFCITIILIIYLQINIERIENRMDQIDVKVDSISLIKTYNYEHSEIK